LRRICCSSLRTRSRSCFISLSRLMLSLSWRLVQRFKPPMAKDPLTIMLLGRRVGAEFRAELADLVLQPLGDLFYQVDYIGA